METSKKNIRKSKLALRKSVCEDELKTISGLIAKELQKVPEYISAESVLLYASYNHEVITDYIFDVAVSSGKKVYFPKVFGDYMKFYRVDDLKELKPGCMNIPEPEDNNESEYIYCPNTIVIMPLAAFDSNCNRIGYGGGYYDKYLVDKKDIFKIGIAIALQEAEQIPAEEHDIKLDMVITEKDIKRRKMTNFDEIAILAKKAKFYMNKLDTASKNAALIKVAEDLIASTEVLLTANSLDIERAKANNMNPGLVDRLLLTEARIQAMAEGVRQVAELPDPVGRLLDTHTHSNGMTIDKISSPFGVVGIIYESRPNVTADAWALTFKAGNVVVLKGGSDAIESNKAITNCIKASLIGLGHDENAIILITDTDRAVTAEFMKRKDFVDVLIPRGGAGLIRSVVENSLIPVIETGTGNCHIYVDEDFNLDYALDIIYNAKTQRIGVCNAMESLVVHEKAKSKLIPAMESRLSEKKVEFRADEFSIDLFDNAVAATEDDFYREYLDYIMSVKTVNSIDEAIAHINEHSTGHSECIISNITENIEKFQKEIDSACVYANVSTRFSDGFEFGLGAEIGISTQKLHARGPMGLNELTTYKFIIKGNGQVRP